MGNVTLAIPDTLHSKMRKHPEFKWSEVARQAIEQKLEDAELLDDLKSISFAEKEFKEKKTVSHKQVLKELGL